MARTLFLFLVLINLLALGWIYLKGDERINAGREPQRAKAELAADKVRLLVPADNAPDALSLAQSSISSAPAADSCRAYAGATVTEAQEIAKAWSGKLPAARIVVNPVMPRPVFDMVIAGLIPRAAAETKLAELKKLGISDSAQIKAEDDKHFLILIASFAERGAAEDALKSATKKGARSAVIVHKQPVAEQSTVEVHGSDATLKLLGDLAALRKGLTPVSCAAQ